jgi:hypothetical protein
MKVKVTADHISMGTPVDSSSCAIALALNEQFGDAISDWTVESFTAEQYDHSLGYRRLAYQYKLPPEAVDFVERFDADPKSVDPFEFDLTEILPDLG